MTKILTKAEWELSVAEAWGKAIESGLRETVAEWMIERDYATGHGDTVEDLLKELEWQVKERERERMIADGWRQCAEGQSTTQYCGLLEDAVKAEREACAKLCEEMARRHDDIRRAALEVVAEWIRARGET
jgi:hypothetical protein